MGINEFRVNSNIWPIFYNCWHTTLGGPVIVSNNNNAGVSGQELPPVLVIGKPPG